MYHKCDVRICKYNVGGKCSKDLRSCEVLDWKKQNIPEDFIQHGDKVCCPSCEEDVTFLLDYKFDYCPYCGKRWYGQ